MNIASLIMNSITPRAQAFEEATRDPIRAQEKVLFKYLERSLATEYGRLYNFASMRSIEDFRSAAPLVNYSAMLPYIERMKKGEENILTPDKVIFFGLTSGSTGKPKFIPVTKYSLRAKDDVTDLWAYYTYRDHPDMLNGRILAIVSPEVKGHTSSGIPYGPEDGHAYNNMPRIIKYFYSLPYDVFSIDDYDARYYAILRISMEQDINIIATLNPSTLSFMCERIGELQKGIIEDIRRGTLNSSFNIPLEIRRWIEITLKPNPKRADELEILAREHGHLLPVHFWPNLEVIECWKGGTVKMYIDSLPQYFGNVAVRDFGCLSTESRSSIPLSDEGSGGVLAVDSNFFEFIPREDIDSDRKRTLLCTEVKEGREYLMVVTTASGLFRYDMDDIVRVSGFYNRAPVIEFVQKAHNAVSITGEKVYESHIVEAMKRASARTGVDVPNYFAYAETAPELRYVFVVELATAAPKSAKEKLLAAIEEELRKENGEYDDLRKQQLIKVPSMRVAAPGEFEKYRRKRVASGAHDTQFKMPRLAPSGELARSFAVTEDITISERYYL